MNIKEFIEKHGIELEYEYCGTTYPPFWNTQKASHFKLKLTRESDVDSSFVCDYYMGPGLTSEPEIEQVLECLHSDVLCVLDYDLISFLEEFGYCDKLREGEQFYHHCKDHKEKLEKFFDKDFDEFMQINFNED